MALISDPVSAVAGVVQSIIDKFPTPEQKAQAQQQLTQMYISGDLQRMTTQAGVITAEANSGSWITKSWRPITMLVFVAIIANNYIIFPYLQLFFHTGLMLQLPPDMWELLKLGIGGYVVGRSIEKVATTITGTSPTQSVTNAVSSIFKGN